MRIDRIELQNFKKFEQQSFALHPHFTLLVGENGSGKTSVLDALAVMMGVWLIRPPDSEVMNSGRKILRSEVRLEGRKEGDRIQFREMPPTVVTAIGNLAGHDNVKWARKNSGGNLTNDIEAKQALEIIKGVYEKDRSGDKIVCPVIAYYGAGRAWLPSNERTRSKISTDKPSRRWAAFYDCLNERIRIPELRKWFKNEAIASVNRSGRMRPGFEVVKRAVLACVPDADDLSFDVDSAQIVFSIKGNAQPFDNLSAGQKMMLALVADIAIKAVTQNAFLIPPDELGPENELPRVLREAPGIVLIDELDVHLHPKWQRRIATDLKKTFPSIQFVCTSHSPQVIGEVKPDEIRLLDQSIPPAQSFGMDSNWIIEVLMQGDERNPEIKHRLEALSKLIDGQRLQEAELEIAKLRSDVGNSDRIQRAASLIERIKLLGK